MLDIKTLFATIKNDFPEQAIDLSECFDLVLETLDTTVERIQNKIASALDSRDFDRAKRLMGLAEEINSFESEIVKIKQNLDPEDLQHFQDLKNDDSKIIPNYEEYYVDTNVPHSLYENLSHKRPFAFEVEGNRVEVRTWIDVLLATCDILLSKDPDKFTLFQGDPKMNGKKAKYFSKDSDVLRKPVKIDKCELYVETNMSANSIRNLIVKMLQKYGIKTSDFVLYLRADYTDLHKD